MKKRIWNAELKKWEKTGTAKRLDRLISCREMRGWVVGGTRNPQKWVIETYPIVDGGPTERMYTSIWKWLNLVPNEVIYFKRKEWVKDDESRKIRACDVQIMTTDMEWVPYPTYPGVRDLGFHWQHKHHPNTKEEHSEKIAPAPESLPHEKTVDTSDDQNV